jgi:DNA-binding SARP family transcriptional activator
MAVRAMEFGLLGPLTVGCGGAAVPVAAGKQRAVLAALLLDAGRVVPVDELCDVLWGAEPPESARASVQNYVRRLRQALGDAGRDRIRTQPGGYLITVSAGELDVTRFEALARSAGAAVRRGAWDDSAGRARAALALWRGEPLADAGSAVLAGREAPRLAELRLQAQEACAEADLHLGRRAEAIAELRVLVGAHPLRERLPALLMLALYWDGRQGEALAAYRQARQALARELGSEPGTGLRELHQRMLAGDPALAPDPAPAPRRAARAALAADAGSRAEAGSPPAAGGPPLVPRQLPGAVPHFTGRAAELAALTRALDTAGEQPGTVPIAAIGGTAGVGKTALAVRWAHQVADRFPDGQLYVNLRGYDPGRPVAAPDALAGILGALGVTGPDVPAGAEERAARYRSLLAGRRVLVVLDNAREVEQVRLLLPGTPGCMVVVTSRDSLAGLVARYGASRLDLDLLPGPDAVGLLRVLIGARADADPGAAAVLAERCAHLPLALRVAAELTADRPEVSLAGLSAELAGLRQRLDRLDAGGDPRTAVRAVFSWSSRDLDPAAARLFALLGLFPGPDLDRQAAAALAGTPAEAAARALSTLARAHLVRPAGPGRYGLHDLLRGYAAEQAARRETGQWRQAALTRLLDYYLHTAAAAAAALHPAAARPASSAPAGPAARAGALVIGAAAARDPGGSADWPGSPVTGADAARAWLDAERPVLAAMTAQAAAGGWPGHATGLSAALAPYLEAGRHDADAVAIHGHAVRAARQAGDAAAEEAALRYLAVAVARLGGQLIGGHPPARVRSGSAF